MGRKQRIINLPAPYLKGIVLDQRLVSEPDAYPFCLPLFKNGFGFDFKSAITIIVGENGTGKSTLLEGIAVLAGFDEAGGAKGYRAGRSFTCDRSQRRGPSSSAKRKLVAQTQ
jgi:predicted ATPase